MQLNHIRNLAVDAPLPSGHTFLSAASGMVVCGSTLWVVADDANCLAQFDLAGTDQGRLIPLFAGDLPSDAAQRKRAKLDLEILLALPDVAGGGLLVLGSGSTAQRMRGAVIDWPGTGEAARVRPLDLAPLVAAIAPLVPSVNLEGAVLQGTHLLLFNRGTMSAPASHVLEVPLAAMLVGGAITATLRAELTLPTCDGVPLTVTDACRLDDGPVLLSAVAEATADSYADGELVGAAIAELDEHFAVRAVEPLEPVLKVEGLAARATADGVQLLCVTDADDPERESGVFGGMLAVSGV